MKPMTFERTIAVDVQAVWSVMTDVRRYAERFSGVDAATLLTEGPFGIGTRWRETRTVYGRPTTLILNVIDAEVPLRYVTEAHAGARATTEFVFTPVDDGRRTLIRVTFQTTGGSAVHRLGQFLAARRIRECVVENNTQDLTDLARACEAVDRK
ncbi:SRPBCC family protein [Dactylosporangium sp. CA-233914]|uniref:SRPBCC family protein n=1 Tax=Dactylosporangium sp. CA-233914 TaxID=3239934 RepID=UPI003D8C94B3